jgi:uncharacterized protein YndB with AHSA1/START domain
MSEEGQTAMIAIAIAAAALAAMLVIHAAAKPGAFRVRRSTRIEAPPEKVRELIDDFHRWASWSPYEDLDPVMRRTYSEPAAGEGAVYTWKSSGRVGAGRMVITESSPSRVVVQWDRAKTHSVARFTLCAANGATEVTWSMEGVGSFLARHTLGREFETGLANLKATVERNWYGPRKPARRAPRRPYRGAIFQPAA